MKGFKTDQAGSAHKPEMYVLEAFICFQCFAFQPDPAKHRSFFLPMEQKQWNNLLVETPVDGWVRSLQTYYVITAPLKTWKKYKCPRLEKKRV